MAADRIVPCIWLDDQAEAAASFYLADEGGFATIWPLRYAEDHAARDTDGCAAVRWRCVAWRWALCGSAEAPLGDTVATTTGLVCGIDEVVSMARRKDPLLEALQNGRAFTWAIPDGGDLTSMRAAGEHGQTLTMSPVVAAHGVRVGDIVLEQLAAAHRDLIEGERPDEADARGPVELRAAVVALDETSARQESGCSPIAA